MPGCGRARGSTTRCSSSSTRARYPASRLCTNAPDLAGALLLTMLGCKLLAAVLPLALAPRAAALPLAFSVIFHVRPCSPLLARAAPGVALALLRGMAFSSTMVGDYLTSVTRLALDWARAWCMVLAVGSDLLAVQGEALAAARGGALARCDASPGGGGGWSGLLVVPACCAATRCAWRSRSPCLCTRCRTRRACGGRRTVGVGRAVCGGLRLRVLVGRQDGLGAGPCARAAGRAAGVQRQGVVLWRDGSGLRAALLVEAGARAAGGARAGGPGEAQPRAVRQWRGWWWWCWRWCWR